MMRKTEAIYYALRHGTGTIKFLNLANGDTHSSDNPNMLYWVTFERNDMGRMDAVIVYRED